MFNEREHYSISFLKFGKSKLNKKNKKFYDEINGQEQFNLKYTEKMLCCFINFLRRFYCKYNNGNVNRWKLYEIILMFFKYSSNPTYSFTYYSVNEAFV